MTRKPKLLTKSFFRSFAILGSISLVIHLAIYFSFPFFYVEQEWAKFNKSATVLIHYLEKKKAQELPILLEAYSKSVNISAHLKKDVQSKRLSFIHDLEIEDTSAASYVVSLEKTITTADGEKATIEFIQGVDIYKEATKILFLYLPYTFLATIVFAFIFSYFYTKRLLEPLFYISKVTNRMQHLDYDIRFDETRKDEIGEVGKQINSVYENLLTVIDELKNRNEHILMLQKQKVSFIRGASHELKTPLAALRIMLENMQYNIGDYKDHSKYLAKSIERIDQMSLLLKEVLESSKFQEWTEGSEKIRIYPVLEEVLGRYQELATSKNIYIDNQLPETASLRMSHRALDKVLANILSNAIKYSTRNGLVTISEKQDYLSIRNTCNPLTEEELEHLFDIFYHAQVVTDKVEGSGLGLYIIKNILESYNISYNFVPYEHGMEFTIQLLSKD